MRKTEIVPWTDGWNDLYDLASKEISSILMNEMIEIHHIGSTSIKEIGFAKPTVDILVIVENIQQVDRYNEQMKSIGYKARGENGIENRRYFTKGGDKRTHHVHIHQHGDNRIHAHLSFKYYMGEHLDDAKAYGELKLLLAEQFPNEIHLYQLGKQDFLDKMVNKAVHWVNNLENNSEMTP